MTIVGRLTKDAAMNVLKDDRKVVNFTLAVNDQYTTKGAKVKVTTYFNCAYWIGEGITNYLKKGTLLGVEGRVFATAFIGTDGAAKASLNCHVNALQFLATPRDVEPIGKAVDVPSEQADPADDLPF